MKDLYIGFDAKRIYNNFSGLGVYSRNVVENLKHFYPQLQLCLFSQALDSYRDEVTPFLEKEKYNNVFCPKKFSFSWRSFSISKDINDQGVQIFHGLSNEIPFTSKKIHCKVVVTIHDIIYKKYPQFFPLIDRMIYDKKVTYACKNADVIIAVSQSTKKDIMKCYGVEEDRICVIAPITNSLFYTDSYSLPLEDIKQQYHLPEDYILSVGTIEERKNLLTLLKAYALLPKKWQIPIVVVGKKTSYQKKLNQFLSSHSTLRKKIFWIDKLKDHRHLKAMYEKASLFVYPSLYEGFGIPVVESLFSKTPVITSNVSSLPEAGGKSSLLVDPLDEKQIKVAIENILSSKSKREKMIKEGYDYAVRNFSPKKLTKDLYNIYYNTLNDC